MSSLLKNLQKLYSVRIKQHLGAKKKKKKKKKTLKFFYKVAALQRAIIVTMDSTRNFSTETF